MLLRLMYLSQSWSRASGQASSRNSAPPHSYLLLVTPLAVLIIQLVWICLISLTPTGGDECEQQVPQQARTSTGTMMDHKHWWQQSLFTTWWWWTSSKQYMINKALFFNRYSMDHIVLLQSETWVVMESPCSCASFIWVALHAHGTRLILPAK